MRASGVAGFTGRPVARTPIICAAFCSRLKPASVRAAHSREGAGDGDGSDIATGEASWSRGVGVSGGSWGASGSAGNWGAGGFGGN
jgi:hypothetical protein